MLNIHKSNDGNIISYVDNLGYSFLPLHMKKWVYTWHRMKYNIISPSHLLHRMSSCRTCKWWSETKTTMRCTHCQCGSEKMILRNSKCPLSDPKW